MTQRSTVVRGQDRLSVERPHQLAIVETDKDTRQDNIEESTYIQKEGEGKKRRQVNELREVVKK